MLIFSWGWWHHPLEPKIPAGQPLAGIFCGSVDGIVDGNYL